MTKLKPCPFCGKYAAEIANCQQLEECDHFEECPAVEPYVCVVCARDHGGCGASGGYYDSVEKAIAAWNSRRRLTGYECKLRDTNAALESDNYNLNMNLEHITAELAPFQSAAAEYGIDAQTMLTLARSQIETAKENVRLREANQLLHEKIMQYGFDSPFEGGD